MSQVKRRDTMKTELEKSIRRFLELFEEVFDNDWKYSKEMMGIYPETDEQRRQAKELGLESESIDIIAENGTFVNPNVEDETEDWGNRGALLSEYRKLKKLIEHIDNQREMLG